MLTSGFYDSIEHDRRYNAEQMSAIFDGIINDGVLINVGNGFMVSQGTGYEIKIGIGRAWFDSTWIYNDNIYLLECPEPELLMDRIDAVVIEVNREDTVRAAFLKIVSGEPSTDPQKPELLDTEYVHQHAIAYIYRNANETEILQSQITYNVGTEECPYVTGILEVMTIEAIVAQWQGEFDEWFVKIKDTLDDDAAGHLANEILKLKTLTEVTLSSGNWSGSSVPYTQTISITGVTADTVLSDLGIMYPTNCSDDNRKAISKAAAYLYDVETAEDSIIFRATKKPDTSFTVGFKGVW